MSELETPHCGGVARDLAGDDSTVLAREDGPRLLPAVSLPSRLLANPCSPDQLPPHMLVKEPGDAVLPFWPAIRSLLNVLRGDCRTLVFEEYFPGSGEVGLDPRGDAILVLGALVTSQSLLSSSSLSPDIRRRARGLKLSLVGVEDVLEEEALVGWRLMASGALYLRRSGICASRSGPTAIASTM